MAFSHYTDGTSALNLDGVAAAGSKVVSFGLSKNPAASAFHSGVSHGLLEDPCSYETYSLEIGSRSDKLKSLVAFLVPSVAALLVILAPVIF